MPRQTLRALELQLERLLIAGARIARTDTRLREQRDALGGFAQRVPALASLVAALDGLHASAERDAPRALLTLLVLVRRARSVTLATRDGDANGVEITERIATPLDSADVAALVRAIDRREPDREARLRAAVLRGPLRDLRLLPACITALDDALLGDRVARDVVPALGRAALARLHAQLDLSRGDERDARRLRCIVAIEQTRARPLVERALQQGGARVRAEALRALTAWRDGSCETTALERLREDDDVEVRAAAMDALATCPGDRALQALLDGLDATGDVREAAKRGLGVVQHPDTAQRLAARLDEAAVAPDVVAILAARNDEAARSVLVRVLSDETRPMDVRTAAGHALWPMADRAALDASSGSAIDEVAREAAIERVLRDGADDAFDAVTRWIARPDGEPVVHAMLGALSGPRAIGWRARCIAWLDDPRFVDAAARALRAMDDREATDALVRAWATLPYGARVVCLDALAACNDARALDALAMDDHALEYWAHEARARCAAADVARDPTPDAP